MAKGMFSTYHCSSNADLTSFPLHQRICSLDANLEPPAYINSEADVNLSAVILDVTKKQPLEKVNIIKDWPAAPQEYLDNTQWEAMRQILTKDLSIIQGPPGTGKTFVSKVALQILVENRSKDDPPIIVAAQTNHALDQLLKHVSKFDPEYIRLGGRSTDEDVKKRALFEVRQATKLPPIGILGMAQKRLDQEAQVLAETLEALSPRNSRNPFSAADLFHLKVISQDQADSLVNGASEWVTGGTESTNETKVWLGKALIQWSPGYREENFGFEEAEDDLEFEQLREHEAESGQTDQEDIELLKGHFCSVEQLHTVSTPPPAVLIKAKKELDLTVDLWRIPQALRGPVYFVLQEKAKTAMAVRFRDQARGFNRICKDLKIGIFERDAVYLAKANIIGLTTTGLSKYRPLIASLKPKIILIEEAAEVIEAPVTAACIESLEHLILVGDHKQLQGHCTVEALGRSPFNLNVSMFERLVNNGIPFKTLLRQRRMDPDFRQLLMPIYPELQDHHDVVTRTPLPPYGMGDVKSFFLDHDWPELRDAQMSHFNDKEALVIAGFYEYLLMNKVPPSKITILTFYNGQRKRILKYIRDRPLCKEGYHNVKTVDGYQGEENEIVILSLVRNTPKSIGFLDNVHRICVALSRARRGFYIFGNANSLRVKSELWNKVFIALNRQTPSRVGTALPLQCNNHGRPSLIEYPEDWNGDRAGCDLPCGGTLDCGHACKRTCHPFEHSCLTCLIPCERKLSCGHPCQKKCFEACFCDCAESDTRDNQGADSDGSGRRGIYDNSSSDRVENYHNTWGNSGNDGWGATDGAADAGDEGDRDAGAAGSGWNTNWGQRAKFNGQPHGRSSSGGRRTNKDSPQVFTRLPIRSEEKAAKDDKLASRSISPPKSHFPASHSSRPSTSSLATQPSYRSSAAEYAIGRGSQHSTEKHEEKREQWGSFANGGVKTDDEERAKARTLELKKISNEAQRNNFDKSTAFLLERALSGTETFTTTTRKDGKKVFTGTYRPVRSMPVLQESSNGTEELSNLVSASTKDYEPIEQSLLD
jgi:helicase required for RNAi-mediated heterochromatin assembly 1